MGKGDMSTNGSCTNNRGTNGSCANDKGSKVAGVQKVQQGYKNMC